MGTHILISIIVPVYQAGTSLRKCVDSILPLLDYGCEIILVDDGSTDSSGAICDDYSLREPNIKVIHQMNGGRSVARNRGMDIAEGKWIMFVDADDWLFRDVVKSIPTIAENSSEDIVIFRDSTSFSPCSGEIESVAGDKVVWTMVTFAQASDLVGKINPRTVWGKLYRRVLVGNTRFIAGLRFGEDAVFNIEAMSGRKVKLIDKSIYRYDIAEASTCSQFASEDINYLIPFFKAVKDAASKKGFPDTFSAALCMNELLELFYRAARLSEELDVNTFLNPCRFIGDSLSYVPLRRNCLAETIRANLIGFLLEHGMMRFAFNLEKTRYKIKRTLSI